MDKIVKTKISQYYLSERDGKTFLKIGSLSGEIVKFHEEVKVGGILEIFFIENGTSDPNPTYLRTSTITEIVNL